jgi:hypothetical protein
MDECDISKFGRVKGSNPWVNSKKICTKSGSIFNFFEILFQGKKVTLPFFLHLLYTAIGKMGLSGHRWFFKMVK